MDPITQKDIEVTKFISYTDKNYFIEANSKTSDEYKLENDMLVGLKSNEESLTYLDTYELVDSRPLFLYNTLNLFGLVVANYDLREVLFVG